MIENSTLASRLLLSRRHANLNQSELSRRAGVSTGYISEIEHEKVTNIGMDAVRALAKALDVSPQWLAGWSDASEKSEELNNDEQELLDLFRELTDLQKTAVLSVARSMRG